MKFQLLVGALIAILLTGAGVHATQLGVNYYHETLMNPGSNGPYIPRSLSEVGQDLDNIKTIGSAVKLYMNPFVDGNLPWIQQVAAEARMRNMRVVVNMMVDDRQITDANWQDYSNRVVSASQALNGKVDEVIVGNEITLHSPLDRADIRDKVLVLEDSVKQVFNGDVSYEEFWYAKDVWKGHNTRLYWMMYEGIDAFRANIAEMDSSWGSNAIVGEWGEDQLEGSARYDEQWQKDQIRQRWEIIQQTNTPYAYIFTYREPNDEAFGIIRADGTKRPLWEVFLNSNTVQPAAPAIQPAQPVTQEAPVVQQPAQQPAPEPVPQPAQPAKAPAIAPPQNINLPLTTAGVDVQSDHSISTACREIKGSVNSQAVQVLACDKGDSSIEMYVQQQAGTPYLLCLGNHCVSNDNGFMRFQR